MPEEVETDPRESSILDDTKKLLGLAPDYDAFDLDVIIGINSALSTLHQLGVGPEDGFSIAGRTSKWKDFIGNDPLLSEVLTYVGLKTRLVFDPPANSYTIQAFEKIIAELEFRLNVKAEENNWTGGR